MAIFDNSSVVSALEGVEVNTESYDLEFGGLENIITESYEAELGIIRSIHAIDMAEIGAKKAGVTEGAELAVAMEGAIGDFFSNIKENLKKFFAKIKAMFTNLFQKLFVFSKSNKSFVESYRKTVEDLKQYITKVEYTEPKWNMAEMVGFGGSTSEMNDIVENFEKFSEKAVTVTDKSVAALTSGDSDDIVAAVKAVDDEFEVAVDNLLHAHNGANAQGGNIRLPIIANFRSLEKSKQTYSAADILNRLDLLAMINEKPFKKAESVVSKNFDKALKTIANAEKRAVAAEKNAAEGDDKKKASATVATIRAFNSIIVKVKSASLQAVSAAKTVATEYSADTKALTIKAIAEGKAKKKEADKNKK